MSQVLDPDVTVIVPALNEQATIKEVVDRLLALKMNTQVVVVDDGSTDATSAILSQFGERITVVRNDSPSGKGMAVRRGLAFARGKVVVIQDADLEYSPEEIPRLVQHILDGTYNVVYGTRFAHGMHAGMALPNKLVNVLLRSTVRVLYGRRITDEATCYKAFKRELLDDMELECVRFEFCPEVTAKAIRLGEYIHEEPIAYEPRSKAAGKKIRWTDAPEAFWTLLKYRFWRPH